MENIVFMELIRRGYNVYVGKIGDKEIDFIAEEQDGTRKIYVQVCLEFTTPSTYIREFNPLQEVKETLIKYRCRFSKNMAIAIFLEKLSLFDNFGIFFPQNRLIS